MFIENKYKKWYDIIVENAQGRVLADNIYVEKHHIIPKCAGGDNSKSNIAVLTAREHFMCHLLLTRCTEGKLKRDMQFALGAFSMNSKLQSRDFNSWEYKKIRESLSASRKGVKRDPAIGRKTSAGLKGNIPWNKGKKIGPHSDESNRKRSATLKGVTDLEKYGVDGAKKRSAKLSHSKKGHKTGMTNLKHSAETKAKMAESAKGKKGPQSRAAKCPTCDLTQVSHRHIKYCKIKVEKIKW